MFKTVADGLFAPIDDFQLSVSDWQAQSAPVFAPLANGFVAVWNDVDGFNDPGVKAQIFSLDGERVGGEFTVSRVTAGDQIQPSVTTLASGRFVVTWTHENANPRAFDVMARTFEADGTPVGSPILVNTVVAGFQTQPVVTPLADGGYVIAWDHADNIGREQPRAQVFDAGGNKVGGEIAASETTAGELLLGDIVALSGGGFVTAWLDWGVEAEAPYENGSPGSRAQIYDAAGNMIGEAFSLNSIFPGYQINPTLAALPDGGFVAAWTDDALHAVDGNQGIWVQRFSAAGAKVGEAVQASTLIGAGGDMAAIEVVPNLGFFVVWTDNNATSENDAGHLRAQLFDFELNRIGEEFAVAPGRHSNHSFPDIEVLANGALVLGWSDRDAANFDENDVRASMLYPVKRGTDGSDSLAGTAGRDFIVGAGGDDQIGGADDDDSLVGGAGRDTLNGGAGADELYGSAGADVLDGGTGADILHGGIANDSFFIDAAGDRVIELSGEGADRVFSSIDYRLGRHVEHLTLVSDAIAGIGNDGANSIVGNDVSNRLHGGRGDDSLSGGGGKDRLNGQEGADLMRGGAGDDLFFVENSGDRTIENIGEGRDIVLASVSYTLGTEIEVLQLVGSSAVDGTGTALANTVIGNDASNALHGGGGADSLSGRAGNDSLHGGSGLDSLWGGAGADRFYFETELARGGVDHIIDFKAADDTIFLDRTVFAGIAADGRLAASAFHVGSRAADASDRIVYDQARGLLFYDADGSGAGAAVLFARVEAKPVLTSGDFFAVG